MSKSIPLESSITRTIITWLNKQPGTFAIKIHGGRWTSGQPDIIACVEGRTYALEVKRPGNKATKLQEATLKKWEEAGAVARVVYSLEDVKKIIGRG